MESSKTHTCPNCGLTAHRISEKSIHYTCGCNDVIRVDRGIRRENNSLFRKLPLYSWFKLNSRGTFNEQSFTLIGTATALFDSGALNFWTMLLPDGNVRFLEESYGFQTVLTPIDVSGTADLHSKLKKANTSKRIKIGFLGEFKLMQLSRFWGFSIKGESALEIAGLEERYLLQSLSGEEYIEVWLAGNDTHIFKHEIIETFDELAMSDVHDAIQFNTTEYVDCASCGSEVYIPYFPLVKNFVCEKCKTLNKFTKNWRWESDGKVPQADISNAIQIPLGTALHLLEDDFIVIGSSIKQDDESSTWQEFTLYCETDGGFAFLNVFNGNFMLVYETMEFPLLPNVNQSYLYFDDIHYNHYNTYEVELLWAEGHIFDTFSENKREGLSYDYIAPPHMISLERDGNQNNYWYRGEYIDRNDIIKQANTFTVPKKIGLGTLEPTSKIPSRTVVLVSAVMILIFILAHLFIEFTGSPSKVVYHQNFPLGDSTKTVAVVSESFTLEDFRSNVQIDANSEVKNNWLSIDYTLVNTTTGEEFGTSKDIEYYSGYAEGEHWTEGSLTNEHLFTAVPKGTYQLNIDAQKGSDAGSVNNLYVQVTTGAKRGLNFWFPLILLLAWPVFKLIRTYAKEQERWSEE